VCVCNCECVCRDDIADEIKDIPICVLDVCASLCVCVCFDCCVALNLRVWACASSVCVRVCVCLFCVGGRRIPALSPPVFANAHTGPGILR